MSVRILFQDLEHSDEIQRECERWADQLREEFPETRKHEVTLTHARSEHEAHVHVTGKNLDLASSATERELSAAVTEAFERVRRQLRKHHDKQIFARRRKSGVDPTESS